jgi:hypothetical protein
MICQLLSAHEASDKVITTFTLIQTGISGKTRRYLSIENQRRGRKKGIVSLSLSSYSLSLHYQIHLDLVAFSLISPHHKFKGRPNQTHTLHPLTGFNPRFNAASALSKCFALNRQGSLTLNPYSPHSNVVPFVLPPNAIGIRPL